MDNDIPSYIINILSFFFFYFKLWLSFIHCIFSNLLRYPA
jgi:hypothetical protein